MMLTFVFFAATSFAAAQGPGGGREPLPRPDGGDDLVDRMMEFDKDKDGKLMKGEVTDERLHRLFDRADANKDGSVTREELAALAAKEPSNGRGGPPGFGPPPGGGPGGFMMGPPRPGEILPQMLQQRLGLSSEQKAELEDLQREVNARLDKILNDDQKKQLKEMRDRGPGGFGPPGAGRRPGEGGPPPPPPDRTR
jgi:hypothetical protein